MKTNMNNWFLMALLTGFAMLATSCTIYNDFDEDVVSAYRAERSPAEPKSSSSEEVKLSSSEESKYSSSEEVKSSSSEEVKSSSSEEPESSSSSEEVSSSSVGCPESFVDERDGREYAIVDVYDRGSSTSRCWFAKNLEYAQEFSECYDGEAKNCKTYGRLYSGDQLNNKGLSAACPEGTHIATLDDLKHFISMTGLKDCSVEKGSTCEEAAIYMKNKQGWSDSGAKYSQSVLGMLPGGALVDEKYALIGENGFWWVSDDSFDAGYGYIVLSEGDLLTVTDVTGEDLPSTYYSIRCVID
ncbi:MAG: hypothetical protein J5791_04755 [Fibrobacter sp.]|nr:hypothetical protein [Fibrobacter sp.]